mmetsp:Transcript_26793/g.58115  ORF Transcript_26793/g.58115 Transcript_26793/m.58115 type:complete len:188 (-) Transcript_26793:107-670(-)
MFLPRIATMRSLKVILFVSTVLATTQSSSSSADAFAPSPSFTQSARTIRRVSTPGSAPRRGIQPVHAVTEEDVIKFVEKAEKLWAEALAARKEANALSDRAEENAEAAAEVAKKANEEMLKGPISLEKIAAADAATNCNLDAGSVLSRALGAAEEADKLEELAEKALAESEKALGQHLKDFPDSDLA